MPDAAYAPFRAQLQTERDRLRDQLAQMGVGSGNLDGNFADSSQVTAERGELEVLAGTLSDTLQEIEDALAKLDAGTYGVCEQCGGSISEARLEAMPAARLCIDCASKRR
jgi:DnaK suppressor protein